MKTIVKKQRLNFYDYISLVNLHLRDNKEFDVMIFDYDLISDCYKDNNTALVAAENLQCFRVLNLL